MAKASGRRKALDSVERLKVWVRSGGRCVICNRYLLEGRLSAREVTFGELAHIVGHKVSAASPRGEDPLPEADRDKAENLVLVCDDEHDEIDKAKVRDLFPVELLRELKTAHEARIQHVTSFGRDRGTTVVRMIGRLRGDAVQLDRPTAASAVISNGRFPEFTLAYGNDGIEIDIRNVPGEDFADAGYYARATEVIDEVVAHNLNEGVQREKISHLSVFGFARWPLLVYLGAQLDDNVPTDIYQLHRGSQSWVWPEESDTTFEFSAPKAAQDASEAILVMNVSGSIQINELPESLASLPRFAITSAGCTPHRDVIASPQSLDAFARTSRQLFSEIEANHKQIRQLHIFAAIPLSAAVALGTVVEPSVHPALTLYDRTSTGYLPVLEVGP